MQFDHRLLAAVQALAVACALIVGLIVRFGAAGAPLACWRSRWPRRRITAGSRDIALGGADEYSSVRSTMAVILLTSAVVLLPARAPCGSRRSDETPMTDGVVPPSLASEAVLEAMPIGLAVVDAEQRLVLFNNCLLRIIGHAAEQLPSRHGSSRTPCALWRHRRRLRARRLRL